MQSALCRPGKELLQYYLFPLFLTIKTTRSWCQCTDLHPKILRRLGTHKHQQRQEARTLFSQLYHHFTSEMTQPLSTEKQSRESVAAQPRQARVASRLCQIKVQCRTPYGDVYLILSIPQLLLTGNNWRVLQKASTISSETCPYTNSRPVRVVVLESKQKSILNVFFIHNLR